MSICTHRKRFIVDISPKQVNNGGFYRNIVPNDYNGDADYDHINQQNPRQYEHDWTPERGLANMVSNPVHVVDE